MAMEATNPPSVDETARKQFESAWHAGRPEPIERFLPPEDHATYLATLEELIHIELEFAWKFYGQPGAAVDSTVRRPPLVEGYLARFPRLNQPAVILRLLEQEYRVRHCHGDHPSTSEYCTRFPGLVVTGQEVAGTLLSKSAASSADDSPLAPGGRVGRYRLCAKHGRGGFGLVWRADDETLGREVALKQLSGQLATRTEYRQRFVAEARIAAQLQHPGIVPVYDLGEGESEPYYTMKLVRGQTLGEAIRRFHEELQPAGERAVEYLRLLNAFLAVTRAMAYAHSRGVIHRDLKPDNILVGDYGETVILDWGLAKVLRKEGAFPEPVPSEAAPSAPAGATQEGTVMGTPAYMAPEQAAGRIEEVDEGSDVYALGAILYQLLTGRPPFQGAHSDEVLRQVLTQEPPRPRALAPGISRPLEAICLRALAKRRDTRYAEVALLTRDLERYLADEPVTAYRESRREALRRWARRHRTAAVSGCVALFLVAAGVVGGLFLWQRAEQRRQQEVDKAEQRRQQEAQELRSSVQATERLALAELHAPGQLHAGQFHSAEQIFKQASDQLGGKPEMKDLQSHLEAQRDRAQRLKQFYQLANEAEKLAFLEYDEEAVAACETGLGLLAAFDHKQDWWLHLPGHDLTSGQRKQLQDDGYRVLMHLAALRARRGVMKLLSFSAADDDLRSTLEAVEMIRRCHESHAARVLEYFCRLALQEPNATAPDFIQPTSAADYYFVGMAQFWIAQDDHISRMMKQALKGSGLDVKDPQAASERLLREAIALDPKHYWNHFWLGWSLAGVRNHPAADLAFNTCVALQPDYGLGYAERAHTLLGQMDQLGKSRVTAYACGALAAASSGPIPVLPFMRPQWYELQPDYAERWRDLERRALQDLEQAAKKEPREPWIHWQCAAFFAYLDRKTEALDACARALELERPLGLWKGQHVFTVKQSFLKDAKQGAGRVAQNEPNNVQAWAVLAAACLALGEDKEAVQAADRALEIDRACSTARAVRGTASLNRKQPDAALEDFRAALDASPGNYQASAGQARAYEELGRHQEALASFGRLVDLAPTDWHRLDARLGRARMLLELGQREEAQLEFGQVLKRAGTNSHRLKAHLGRARALVALGRPEEARQALEQAGRIDAAASKALATELFPRGP